MNTNSAKLRLAFTFVLQAYSYAFRTYKDFSALVLDELTGSHTAFATFAELLNAPGGYRPTLLKAPANYDASGEIVSLSNGRKVTRGVRYAELDLLALAYDMAQEARGDSRRAFRS